MSEDKNECEYCCGEGTVENYLWCCEEDDGPYQDAECGHCEGTGKVSNNG